MRKNSANSRWRLGFLAMMLALVLGIVVAGCGGGDDDTTGSGGSTAATSEEAATGGEATTEEGSGAGETAPGGVTPEVEELITKATGVQYEDGALDENGLEAFEKAAETQDLTPEQEDLAFECWTQSTCTLGDGELTYGVADGFGGNTWRKFTKMEGILQAMAYPEIGKYIYLDAEADLAKMQSNIRSLSTQGADIITSFDDFGSAVTPAFAAAQRAGAVVSVYVGPVEDADASAITTQVVTEWCDAGKAMVDAAAEILKEKGNLALFGGPPGNPQGKTWWGCAEEQLDAEYPGMQVTYKGDTEWTAASAAKAASAAIASGKPIDLILYDYAEPVVNIVDAYKKAGKTPPAFVTVNQSNGLVTNWSEAQGSKDAYALDMTSSLAYVQRISITAAINKIEGEEVPNEIFPPLDFIPAAKDQVEPDKPSDYPGPTVIVPTKLAERMLTSG
ncbi:MAG TPA: substrate-binding domain-containing protein [Solirubrobacterales bacterium]|nr:substrate-binding domain-containing protein [Solirubrobacterales bacterium]